MRLIFAIAAVLVVVILAAPARSAPCEKGEKCCQDTNLHRCPK